MLPAQVYCETQNLHLQTHVDIHTIYPSWGRGTYTKIQVVHINTAYVQIHIGVVALGPRQIVRV